MECYEVDVVRSLHAQFAEKGVHFLDAPVSGGSQGAEQGTLTIMVGGECTVFERALPVLEAMGKKENIVYVGPNGSGEIIKIVNNMLVGTIAAATAEHLTAPGTPSHSVPLRSSPSSGRSSSKRSPVEPPASA